MTTPLGPTKVSARLVQPSAANLAQLHIPTQTIHGLSAGAPLAFPALAAPQQFRAPEYDDIQNVLRRMESIVLAPTLNRYLGRATPIHVGGKKFRVPLISNLISTVTQWGLLKAGISCGSAYFHTVAHDDTPESLGELPEFRHSLDLKADKTNGTSGGRFSIEPVPLSPGQSDKAIVLDMIKKLLRPSRGVSLTAESLTDLAGITGYPELRGRVLQNQDFLILEIDNRHVLGSDRLKQDIKKFRQMWKEQDLTVPADYEEQILDRIVFIYSKNEDMANSHFLIQLSNWANPQLQPEFLPTYTYILAVVREAIRSYRTHREHLASQKALNFLSQERAAAEKMQRRSIPSIPRVSFADVAYSYQPAQDIGGDFIGAIAAADGSLRTAVADAMGKGLPAAYKIRLFSSIFTSHIALTPANVHAEVNRLLLEENKENVKDGDGEEETVEGVENLRTSHTIKSDDDTTVFISSFTFSLDRCLSMTCSHAGAEKPLIYRQRDNDFYDLPLGASNGGMFLGIFDPYDVHTATNQLLPGDIIVTFSDGITERMDAEGNIFGIDRFQTAIRQAAKRYRSARAMVNYIRAQAAKFAAPLKTLNDDESIGVIVIPPVVSHEFQLAFPGKVSLRSRKRGKIEQNLLEKIGHYEKRQSQKIVDGLSDMIRNGLLSQRTPSNIHMLANKFLTTHLQSALEMLDSEPGDHTTMESVLDALYEDIDQLIFRVGIDVMTDEIGHLLMPVPENPVENHVRQKTRVHHSVDRALSSIFEMINKDSDSGNEVTVAVNFTAPEAGTNRFRLTIDISYPSERTQKLLDLKRALKDACSPLMKIDDVSQHLTPASLIRTVRITSLSDKEFKSAWPSVEK